MQPQNVDLLTHLRTEQDERLRAIDEIRREAELRIRPLQAYADQCAVAIAALLALAPAAQPKPEIPTIENDIPPPEPRVSTRTLVLKHLGEATAPMTKEDIYSKLAEEGHGHVKVTTVGSLLSVMAKEGVLEKQGFSHYRLKREPAARPMPANLHISESVAKFFATAEKEDDSDL